MLAVVAHFVSDQYTIEAPLLSLRSLDGPHLGENQAGAVLSTLESYSLKGSAVSCFMLDNAYNNNMCVQQLGIDLKWSPDETP
jgi:hypothetical protein